MQAQIPFILSDSLAILKNLNNQPFGSWPFKNFILKDSEKYSLYETDSHGSQLPIKEFTLSELLSFLFKSREGEFSGLLFIVGFICENLKFPLPVVRYLDSQHLTLFCDSSPDLKNKFIFSSQTFVFQTEEDKKTFLNQTKLSPSSFVFTKTPMTDILNHAVEEFYPTLKDENIRFHIVTPSYNHEKYIEKTIQSLLNQNYKNYEYIVADGGSKDGTSEILKRYQEKICWFSKKDRGYAEAVQRGFETSLGDYGLWIPSDDLLFDEYSLARLAKAIHQNSADVIYGESFYFNDSEQILSSYPTEEFNFEKLKNNCFICQPSVAFRKDLFDQVHGLDINLRSIADYDLWLKLAQIGAKFHQLPLPISLYRLQENSITVSQRLLTFKEIFENQLKHFGKVHSNWVYGAIHELLLPSSGTSGLTHSPNSQSNFKKTFKQTLKKALKKFFFSSFIVELILKHKPLQLLILKIIKFKQTQSKR